MSLVTEYLDARGVPYEVIQGENGDARVRSALPAFRFSFSINASRCRARSRLKCYWRRSSRLRWWRRKAVLLKGPTSI